MADLTSTQVRRPQDQAELIEALAGSDKPGSHGSFKTYRDVMLFAAAVGWDARREEPFTKSHLPIEGSSYLRWVWATRRGELGGVR